MVKKGMSTVTVPKPQKVFGTSAKNTSGATKAKKRGVTQKPPKF